VVSDRSGGETCLATPHSVYSFLYLTRNCTPVPPSAARLGYSDYGTNRLTSNGLPPRAGVLELGGCNAPPTLELGASRGAISLEQTLGEGCSDERPRNSGQKSLGRFVVEGIRSRVEDRTVTRESLRRTPVSPASSQASSHLNVRLLVGGISSSRERSLSPVPSRRNVD
jgi:hypothetical protein